MRWPCHLAGGKLSVKGLAWGVAWKLVRQFGLSKILFLFSLTTLASVFHAARIPGIGGTLFPLVPVVMFQILLVILYAVSFVIRSHSRLSSVSRDLLFWLIFFLLYASSSAVVLPYLFEGIPVFNSRIGIDHQVRNMTPLAFSVSNVGQVLYLCLNVLFFIGSNLYFNRGREREHVFRVFLFSGLIVCFFAFYQKLNQLTGIYYPYEIVNSNDLYAQLYQQFIGKTQRISATFTEASYAGNVLGTFFVYYLFLLYYGRFRGLNLILFVVYLVATLLTTSSVGYVQIIFGLGVISIFSLKNLRSAFYTLVFVSLIAGGLALDHDVLLATLVNKQNSLSFIHRVASDEYSLKLFFNTYGMGVGLGGNRPSSFLTYMLSNVGLIGSWLFLMFIFAVVKPVFRNDSNLSPEQKALFWGLLSHLLGKVLGVPDLSFWFFWVLLAVSAIVLRGASVQDTTWHRFERRGLSTGIDMAHGTS